MDYLTPANGFVAFYEDGNIKYIRVDEDDDSNDIQVIYGGVTYKFVAVSFYINKAIRNGWLKENATVGDYEVAAFDGDNDDILIRFYPNKSLKYVRLATPVTKTIGQSFQFSELGFSETGDIIQGRLHTQATITTGEYMNTMVSVSNWLTFHNNAVVNIRDKFLDDNPVPPTYITYVDLTTITNWEERLSDIRRNGENIRDGRLKSNLALTIGGTNYLFGPAGEWIDFNEDGSFSGDSLFKATSISLDGRDFLVSHISFSPSPHQAITYLRFVTPMTTNIAMQSYTFRSVHFYTNETTHVREGISSGLVIGSTSITIGGNSYTLRDGSGIVFHRSNNNGPSYIYIGEDTTATVGGVMYTFSEKGSVYFHTNGVVASAFLGGTTPGTLTKGTDSVTYTIEPGRSILFDTDGAPKLVNVKVTLAGTTYIFVEVFDLHPNGNVERGRKYTASRITNRRAKGGSTSSSSGGGYSVSFNADGTHASGTLQTNLVLTLGTVEYTFDRYSDRYYDENRNFVQGRLAVASGTYAVGTWLRFTPTGSVAGTGLDTRWNGVTGSNDEDDE